MQRGQRSVGRFDQIVRLFAKERESKVQCTGRCRLARGQICLKVADGVFGGIWQVDGDKGSHGINCLFGTMGWLKRS